MNEFVSALIGIIALSTVAVDQVYVSPSGNNTDGLTWATAFHDVADGINAAQNNSADLWIAEGTYNIAAAKALYSSLNIYGGFPLIVKSTAAQRDPIAYPTILDRGSQEFAVFTINDKFDVRIDGLTFTTVKNGSDKAYEVEVINTSNNINIFNCEFTSEPNAKGGDNRAPGLYVNNSSVTVGDSLFADLTAINGAAINALYSTLNVYGSLFSGCAATQLGGAIRIYETTLTLDRSIFGDNSATDGGAIEITNDWHSVKSFNAGSPKISNSLFDNNAASNEGGAISMNRAQFPELIYNTFVDNTAPTRGGAIYFNEANANIINNIFDGNTGTYTIFENNNNAVVVDNNLFNNNGQYIMYYAGGTSIDGVESKGFNYLNDQSEAADNINGDPLFVDRDGGDFHILVTSPAIDTGKEQAFGSLDIDIDARPYDVPYHPFTQLPPKPASGPVDIGFDEAVITSETDTDEDTWTDYDELEAGTDPLDEFDFPSTEGEGEGVLEGEGEGLLEGEGEGEGLLEGEGEGEYVHPKHPACCGPASSPTPGSRSGNVLTLFAAIAGLLIYRTRKVA